jgi:hypothetical protein
MLRRGTIYVAVVGVALIVSALGAVAIHVARTELHGAVIADEMARARLAAQSGIEYAISVIKGNTDWRTAYTSGVATTFADARNTLTGTGSFSFTFIDSDGNLADDDQDSVTLRSVGAAGNARSVVEVLLQPSGLGLSCLTSSLHSNGILRVTSTLTTNQRVSANSNINVATGRIQGSAASTGTISGEVSVLPTQMNVTPPWEMPKPENAFEYYKANGTAIHVSSLGGNTIQRVVLSPASNPFGLGVTNPQGIYVIDCQGASITLKDCRIVGTLVLLNAGSGTNIKDSIILEPAIANFPALMVQGSFEVDWYSDQQLMESNLNVNLNPVGTPLNGDADTDKLDTWPGSLKGLVYVSGNLLVKNKHAKVNGVIVAGGTINVESPLTLTNDSTFYNNPPPGFATGSVMKIEPGTWKRVAY